jgi:hypothetical protein
VVAGGVAGLGTNRSSSSSTAFLWKLVLAKDVEKTSCVLNLLRDLSSSLLLAISLLENLAISSAVALLTGSSATRRASSEREVSWEEAAD